MQQPKTSSLRLLLACARAHPTREDEANIRQILDEDIDWTQFAQKVIDHGVAGLVGHSLARLLPDRVPGDILGAFQALIQQTRDSNQANLNELFRLVDQLAAAGVETISFKGPVLTVQAYGDLGLRAFRDLDFLIRDRDLSQTIKTLDSSGYERLRKLTTEQLDLVHRLQGQEILFKKNTVAIEPHTRLTPQKMALDIDYDGLWRRAQRTDIFGRALTAFAPEDTFLVLAIHGGKELWWDIKWACDVADFLAAHPQLDWQVIAARARAYGCHRMLLVATSLARNFLGARVPDFIAAMEKRDPALAPIIGRIMARWEMDNPGGPPSNKTVSMDRLRLHDGMVRKTSYVLRTLLLPGPQHIALARVPKLLGFLYIPLGLAHDLIALPLYLAWRKLLDQADRIQAVLMLSSVPLSLMPVSPKTRSRWRRLRNAYRHAEETVAAHSTHYGAWTRLGDALLDLKRYQQAILSYDKALALLPDNLEVWRKRSVAVAAFRKAENRQQLSEEPVFDPQNADGWALRAGYLLARERYLDASEASQRALYLDSDHEAAMRIGIMSRQYACDWSQYQEDRLTAARNVNSDAFVIRAVSLKQISDSEELSFSLARFVTKRIRPTKGPLWRGEHYRHKKIRIAYLSTDFRSHPVGSTIVAPLEHHDKERFEITAVSLGLDDGSHVRRRIQSAVDRFIDASAMSDLAVAELIRELEIDIVVDLNGLTGLFRSRILAHRTAPVQVNYLGYPGTMGASFIDYIIADKIVIPEENRIYYSEQIARLPHAYLPCGGARAISERTPNRAEEGLPDTGFVFACFNSMHKLVPDIFSIWMRILHAICDSVLWIPGSSPAVIANLRREAMAQGIAPERLIFARFEKSPENHLARLRLADLFLDTLPYSAHSTAADALWAGLPLLTCLGQSFQARVAASLLQTMGLPELVTTSLAEYEKRAVALARDPQQLAAIREKLARNRDTTPLFDTAGFTRDLESVYTAMWERQQSGLAPESFQIATGN
jgi:predicted O-linked N-acetylglucosamine transferase (SPINDLY family)